MRWAGIFSEVVSPAALRLVQEALLLHIVPVEAGRGDVPELEGDHLALRESL